MYELCGPIDWESVRRAVSLFEQQFDEGSATLQKINEALQWIKEELAPRLKASNRSYVDPSFELSVVVRLARHGMYDDYVEKNVVTDPPPFIAASKRKVLDKDALLLSTLDTVKVKFSFHGWLDATVCDDRRTARLRYCNVDGETSYKVIDCLPELYGEEWVVATESGIKNNWIPLLPSEKATMKDNELWVVKTISHEWMLCKLDADGWMAQTDGLESEAELTTFRFPFPRGNVYGSDYGVMEWWDGDPDCDTKALPSQCVYVKHPVLRDAWTVAMRHMNAWYYIVEGGSNTKEIDDLVIGEPDNMGAVWKNVGT